MSFLRKHWYGGTLSYLWNDRHVVVLGKAKKGEENMNFKKCFVYLYNFSTKFFIALFLENVITKYTFFP